MKIISIDASNPYSIYLGTDVLKTPFLKECSAHLKKRVVIISDSIVAPLHANALQTTLAQQGLKAELFTFPAGECYKTRQTKGELEDQLLSKGYGRDTCIIALGGGVVLDLVGFLAATFCRGVPVIYIPTTLLAMVDASIGGKTGVNTPRGKNLVGTITPPHAVFIDPAVLITLSDYEYYNGLCELIKHSVIANAALFKRLQTEHKKIMTRDLHFLSEMIETSCRIKKSIVEQDEQEEDLRQLLNFGHTIGHAIETQMDYSIGHGYAVALGMVVEAYLSMRAGYLPEGDFTALQTLLHAYGLLLKTTAFNNKPAFCELLKADKKAIGGAARFVFIESIGTPLVRQGSYSHPIEEGLLNEALDWAAVHLALRVHRS